MRLDDAAPGPGTGRIEDTRPVGVAVVGAGYWGPNLIRNLREIPEAELVLVCDLQAQALEDVRRRHPEIATTQRYAEVLDDPRVEAVVVATPVSTHFALARDALEAGKHVLVEKPLASSYAEGEELVELAALRELVLMPGHTFLYSPPVNKIREMILSGEIGEIYFISMSRVNLGLHQSDVSVVWDLGPHDFSILLHWLGESPHRLSAMSRGCVIPSIPDVVFINLEFPSGTIAHIELSWLAPSKLRRTTIVGSRRMVVYDDTSNEPVRTFDSGVALAPPGTFGEFRLTYRTGDIVSPRIEAVEPLALEMEDFCAAVRHGIPMRSSPELGLEVISLLEAVDRSLDSHGQPMTLAKAGPRSG
jgi:predicted dehydrogenase